MPIFRHAFSPLLCAPLLAASLAGPASAHHSPAMFDTTRSIVLEGTVKAFDNPESFTARWSARVQYRRTEGPIAETLCAENNKDASTQEDYPIPVAAKADF